MSNSINTTNQGNNTMNDAIFALYPTINKSLAIKTQDADLAHDLTMDTLTKAIDKQTQFDADKSKLITWVQRIAFTTLTDYFRSYGIKNVVSGIESDTMELLAGGYDVDYDGVSVDNGDFWGSVESITNTKEYGCLVRRFRDGMSYTDIAADMGIPKGSVMSALSNGKRKLKESNGFKVLFS
tara:strand:+ start:499 stop:1044 length:546 start_codon:yes stop_codon:yes gene_type:complete